MIFSNFIASLLNSTFFGKSWGRSSGRRRKRGVERVLQWRGLRRKARDKKALARGGRGITLWCILNAWKDAHECIRHYYGRLSPQFSQGNPNKQREKPVIPLSRTSHSPGVRICKNLPELSQPNVDNELRRHAWQILKQSLGPQLPTATFQTLTSKRFQKA